MNVIWRGASVGNALRIILNHKLLKQFLFISIDNLNYYFHTVHSY